MFKINGEILLLLGTSRRSTSQFFSRAGEAQLWLPCFCHISRLYIPLPNIAQETCDKRMLSSDPKVQTCPKNHIKKRTSPMKKNAFLWSSNRVFMVVFSYLLVPGRLIESLLQFGMHGLAIHQHLLFRVQSYYNSLPKI